MWYDAIRGDAMQGVFRVVLRDVRIVLRLVGWLAGWVDGCVHVCMHAVKIKHVRTHTCMCKQRASTYEGWFVRASLPLHG